MKLFGGLLLASGVLIMTASGLCSLVVSISALNESISNITAFPVVLLVGGVPFLIGFGLFRWGRSLIRQSTEAEPEVRPDA